jgi:hypothetical protein
MEVNDPNNNMYYDLLEDAPYESGSLCGYHSGITQWQTTQRSKYRFGFEAEKECSNGRTIAERYQGHNSQELPHSYRAERDGSLGYAGFELISPVYSLKEDVYLEHLRSPILSYLIHANTSYRCGGHITVSVKGWDRDNYHAKCAQILPLLYALYPKRAKTRGYSQFYTKGDENARYNAMNCSDDKMEIRIFAGIKKLSQLKWRVELLRILFIEIPIEKGFEAIYKSMLDISSPLAQHMHKLYGKKYGEKIMLTHAYHRAFEKETLTWKDFRNVRKHIPSDVRNIMQVQPEPEYINPLQLRLDVCDYCEETTNEA